MWTCDELVFDASVRVCAPIVERGAPQPVDVRRWVGRHVEPAPPAAVGATWTGLLVRDDEPPAVALTSVGRLGDLATATAGFRQQFYGLAPFVVDRADADEQRWPRLVTCGALDVGGSAWGERPIRFGGRRWQHPRLDRAALPVGALRRWVDERLVPKVVLATQTKVLEAAIDADGTWVPSTPVIAVHTEPLLLARVAAVLLAPPVSAWAARRSAGTALAANAIKLSARQVLEIPLPDDDLAWDHATAAIAAGDLASAAESMNTAYGAGDDVLAWWARRQ
jgi:hypothetical protein